MAAGGVDVYFIHPDHLDTARVIVNANNQKVWLWDSAPFGDTAANEQPTGGLPNFTFNLRLPGQQYDRETGTHYNYFRDYEAGTGRYVQSDPIGLLGGLSTYGYVEQSPLANFDPLGLARGPNGRFLPDPNKDPNAPKWTDTDRRKHWEKHCEDPNSPLTDEERDDIRKRGYRGPQRLNEDGELETMELSHEPIPIRDGGTETVPRWPADHAAVDPHRHLKKKKCPC